MQKKMQKISESSKIDFILQSMLYEKSKLNLWQERHGDTRKINLSRILRYDQDKEEILFTSGQKPFDFEASQDLYCFWESKQMVFKSQIKFISEFKLAINRPQNIMTIEKRIFERIDCSKYETGVSFELGNIMNSNYQSFPYSSVLFDYSSQGMGMKVNQANISKFIVGDRLTMKIPFLGNQVRLGKISYISNHSKDLFRVGISLQ